MQLLDVTGAGVDYDYCWPSGSTESYSHWIEYCAVSAHGKHSVRIGFGMRATYGQDRKRVVLWIDDHPHAEFLAADDFECSGEVLCEIRVPGNAGERICRYLEETIPERYSGLPIVGLRTRVTGIGVHNAWAAVMHIADHRRMFAVAALRRLERNRP